MTEKWSRVGAEAWADAQPIPRTPAEAYLRGRGISKLPGPEVLRCHPAVEHPRLGRKFPALIARVTGTVEASHNVTWLAADGKGKANIDKKEQRRTLGASKGGAVHLAEPIEGRPLLVGEGPETVLSVMEATGLPGWASLGTSGLKNIEWPASVSEIIPLAENDENGANQRALAKACSILVERGLQVRIATPPDSYKDFNDIIDPAKGGGPAGFAIIRTAIETAQPWPATNTDEAEAGDAYGSGPALAEGGEAAMAELVEKAKETPGVVFEENTLEALRQLVKNKFSTWVNLRRRLKREVHDVPIAELDKRLKLNGDGEGGNDGLPGRAVSYDAVEPWDEPVDGAKLLTELADAIRSYVVMDSNQRDAVALWAVFGHTHDFRDYAPLLIITSPMRRCGKTKLLETVAHLVPKPEAMSGVSAALLPRLIERHRPTLLIDEFDALMKGDKDMAETLRGLLNSSFNRVGAGVLKLVSTQGGDWQERRFSLWTPACISGIGKPPDTVEDRAVNVRLVMKLVGETVKRLRGKDGGELDVLRRKIARWVADNEYRLRTITPKALAGLNDRQQDAWEPLFAIADVAGGDWPKRACTAAVALCGVDQAEAQERDIRLLLLADIRDIFAEVSKAYVPHDAETEGRPDDGPRLATKELLVRLCAIEERPWGAWGQARKPMTDTALAGQLKPYGIRSTTVRTETGAVAKGYYLASFEGVLARYLPSSGVFSRYDVTNRRNPGENDDLADVTNSVCNGGENAQKPSKSGVCNVVTAENGGERGSGGSDDDLEAITKVDLVDTIIAYVSERVEVSATPDRLFTVLGQSLDSDAAMIARLKRIEGDLARHGITMTFAAGGHVVFGRAWGSARA
jgi:hypothetical protein